MHKFYSRCLSIGIQSDQLNGKNLNDEFSTIRLFWEITAEGVTNKLFPMVTVEASDLTEEQHSGHPQVISKLNFTY